MASLWELMAERENTQMAAMKEKQAQFSENQRQRDLQTGLRQAVASRPQQTTFAEPVQSQPTTLAGLAPSLQADPSLTPITGRSGMTPEQAAYGYLRENSPLDATDYSDTIMKQAQAMAQTGDHRGAVDFVNKSLGTKLEYQGSKGELLQVKNDDGTVLLYNTTTGEEKVIGTPKQRAPISVAQGATLLDPVTMQPVYSSPKAPDYKQRERIDGNRTVFEQSTDGGQTWTRVSEGPRYKPASAPAGGGTGTGGRTGGIGGKPPKPLPPTALKLQDEHVQAIGTTASLNKDLDGILTQLDTGALNLGLWDNTVSRGRNAVGWTSENSRNFSTFRANLEKLRNDSLRLNKGVQTEGDAQRAWNEILTNLNDEALVKQRLAEVKVINDRAVALRTEAANLIRSNYGHDPLDTTNLTNVEGATNLNGKGTNGIPQAAISHLKKNPQLRAAFDQKYGKGAAAKVLGR